MHPQIVTTESGLCPICAMDLVEMTGSETSDDFTITLTDSEVRRSGIETVIIKKQNAKEILSLNGKLEIPEENLVSINQYFPGRIIKLADLFTGKHVKAGDFLAEVYSPLLNNAKEELLISSKQEKMGNLYKTSVLKLKGYGLSDSDVKDILQNGYEINHTIRFSKSGFITKKFAKQNDNLPEGGKIVEIADLKTLRAEFEIYQQDLRKIKVGDKFKFETVDNPGTFLEGKVSLISPFATNNLVKFYAEIDNQNLDLTGNLLVRGEFAYEVENKLLVPVSSLLWTGDNSIVYKKTGENSFKATLVSKGSRYGDLYEILSGISEGDEIATKGSFIIDSKAQLNGKISMMNQGDSSISLSENDGRALKEIIKEMIELNKLLVESDFEKSVGYTEKMKFTANNDQPEFQEIRDILHTMRNSKDLEELRKMYKGLNNTIISLCVKSKILPEKYVVFCPMADNNTGGYWLSDKDEVVNPYFGDMMLNCGEVKGQMGSLKNY